MLNNSPCGWRRKCHCINETFLECRRIWNVTAKTDKMGYSKQKNNRSLLTTDWMLPEADGTDADQKLSKERPYLYYDICWLLTVQPSIARWVTNSVGVSVRPPWVRQYGLYLVLQTHPMLPSLLWSSCSERP